MHLSTTFTLTLISLLVDQTPYEAGTVRTECKLAQVRCHELVTVYGVNFSSQCALSTSLAPALRVLLENSTKRFYRRALEGGKAGERNYTHLPTSSKKRRRREFCRTAPIRARSERKKGRVKTPGQSQSARVGSSEPIGSAHFV